MWQTFLRTLLILLLTNSFYVTPAGLFPNGLFHNHHSGLLHKHHSGFLHNAVGRIAHLTDLKHFISGHEIQFPCKSTKNIYISSGRYEPRNIIATRLQIGRDHAYIALPRLKPGVPFTLGRIPLRKSGCKTELEPYPCWSIQEEGNCESLQSVVDLFLDEKHILWVLDSGIVNTLQQPIRRCRPKVLGIDTHSNRVIKRIDLSDVITSDSRLQYILVDYDEHGHPFIYVSDSGSAVILVHDPKSQKNHRVVLPSSCIPDKKDVLYMVLVKKQDSCPLVYFTYLHSNRLYYIKSENLRKGSGSGSLVDVAEKPTAALILLGTDNGSGIYMRFRGDGDIYMWNSDKCFKEDNLELVQSGGDCRLSTQVAPGNHRFMWTIESNFQDYVNKECGCYGPSISIRPLSGFAED